MMTESGIHPPDGAPMTYKNREMKLDELLGYFRDEKINLIPPFQRGRVWTRRLRKKLLENMVRGKPIPAIFLYKEAEGSRFTYNILDGKQRLESILLFVGNNRQDLAVPNWRNYFFRSHSDANFKINVAGEGERTNNKAFAELDQEVVREFREYSVPTIEIDMDKEEGGFKEVVDLFIDINQYGVKVNRFDIIRTMYDENRLLADVFKLIGQKQRRRKDLFYKSIDSDFTRVLKRLKNIAVLATPSGLERHQERVDRMWERLLEIVLFIRTGEHRTLGQVLKAFLGGRLSHDGITAQEKSALRKLFKFLRGLYSQKGMKDSKLVTDQPHFYTMVTSIHALNLIGEYGDAELKRKLVNLSGVVEGDVPPPKGKANMRKEYLELSSKQTTHPSRRASRQDRFVELLAAV
jgi:hypothetical protein